jgi:hypothetical protein
MNSRSLLNETKCREMIAWIEKNPGNPIAKIRKETQGTYHTWRQIEHLTNVCNVPGKTPPALPIRRNDQPFSIRTDFHLESRADKAKGLGAREGEKLCYKCICLKPLSAFHTVRASHDEGLFIAPESEAEEAKAFALECFSTVPPWLGDCPLVGEAGYAKRYGET